MGKIETFNRIHKNCDEINEIVCTAYQTKYLGDVQVSEIQAILCEITNALDEVVNDQRSIGHFQYEKLHNFRKGNHLCIKCGKPLANGYKKMHCFDCLQYYRARNEKRKGN